MVSFCSASLAVRAVKKSPGGSWMMMNVTSEIARVIGIMSSRRRRMKVSMTQPFRDVAWHCQPRGGRPSSRPPSSSPHQLSKKNCSATAGPGVM